MVTSQDVHDSRTNVTEQYLSVDISAMTYILINSVKEQQKQIDELKKLVQIQKTMIDTLTQNQSDIKREMDSRKQLSSDKK